MLRYAARVVPPVAILPWSDSPFPLGEPNLSILFAVRYDRRKRRNIPGYFCPPDGTLNVGDPRLHDIEDRIYVQGGLPAERHAVIRVAVSAVVVNPFTGQAKQDLSVLIAVLGGCTWRAAFKGGFGFSE